MFAIQISQQELTDVSGEAHRTAEETAAQQANPAFDPAYEFLTIYESDPVAPGAFLEGRAALRTLPDGQALPAGEYTGLAGALRVRRAVEQLADGGREHAADAFRARTHGKGGWYRIRDTRADADMGNTDDLGSGFEPGYKRKTTDAMERSNALHRHPPVRVTKCEQKMTPPSGSGRTAKKRTA